MNSVWLLTNQQDYESEETLCVYRDKPSGQELLGILSEHHNQVMEDDQLLRLASELHCKCLVEVWGLYTYRLTKWELK